MKNLISALNNLCDQHEFHTGWYLKNLKTGESADRNGDVIVPSASTRKIAILMTALKEVNDGKLSLGQRVTIESRYQDNTSGCFQHLEPGFTITLKDALVMMIIVSDNTCTGTVADIVGLDAVNELSQSIGMRGTAHRFGIPPKNLDRDHPLEANNTTTPTDVGVLLNAILSGSRDASAAAKLGCTPELCSLALDILSKQNLKARLPYMLPAGSRVAHKNRNGCAQLQRRRNRVSGRRPVVHP